MGVDLSIYNALLQRGPSAMEVANALSDRRMREQDQATQRQLNALQLQKTQFDMEGARQSRDEENALRAYLGSNPDLTTNEGQMGLYKVAPKAAGGILKERSAAAAQDATRLNQQREAQIKTLQFLGQVAGGVRDQASYDAALATMRQAGIDPASIGAPAQYNPQVVANFGQQALTQAQRLEQEWKAKEFGLKAGNELIGPDGQVNQKVLSAKQSVARSGASNISLNTEKSLLGTVADNVGKDIVATSEGARSAQNTLSAVNRIRTALESGKAITGVGANQRVILGQIGETLGLGSAANQETLARTRDAIQGLAQLELEGAGSMKGQGQITEGERALLRKAASGDITMTAPELKSLMNTFERTANYRIGRNKSNVETLRKNPNAASVVPFLEANGQGNEDFTGGMAAAIAAEAARRAKLNGGR